jgi:hypothetical protein
MKEMFLITSESPAFVNFSVVVQAAREQDPACRSRKKEILNQFAGKRQATSSPG